MLNLDKYEIQFLEEVLGISREELDHISKERWIEIKSMCFDVEADELIEWGAAHDSDYDSCDTDEYLLAVLIQEIPYKDLYK